MMRLIRLGDFLAILMVIPVLALTTRAGSGWMIASATQNLSAAPAPQLLMAMMAALLAVLGWAIFRVTGGISLVAGISVAAAGLAALSLGYPAWQRGAQMRALAPVFAGDIGPVALVPGQERIRLADYRDGAPYGRGVTCHAGCLALLAEGLTETVVLSPEFDAAPEGLSVRLDRDTQGCRHTGSCLALDAAEGPAPRLTVLRSVVQAGGAMPMPPEARGLGLTGFMRTEVYLGKLLILRRTSIQAPGLDAFSLPVYRTGIGFGYPRRPVWLAPQRLKAHAPLPEILRAVSR